MNGILEGSGMKIMKQPKQENIMAKEVTKQKTSKDGIALTSIEHPKGDYENGRLYVSEGSSQTFLPHSVLNEDSIESSTVELSLNDVQLMTLKNQQIIMKALYIMAKTMVGDMNLAEELKQQSKDNFEYLRKQEK